jgi:hypothetical protein
MLGFREKDLIFGSFFTEIRRVTARMSKNVGGRDGAAKKTAYPQILIR